MADMGIEFCGIRFKNPVLPAAGPPGWDGAALLRCAQGGAGGLVTKTISTRPAVVPRPHMAAPRGAFLNVELWSELSPRQWALRECAMAKSTGLPLIISLGYSAADIEELAPLFKPWADAVELSTHYTGDSPEPMVQAIRAARRGFDVPVWVKLSPFRDVQQGAAAAQQAGADGLVAINSFGPTMSLDVETAMPVLGSANGYGWMSGAAIRPLAVRCVWDIAQVTDLPIMGVGGIGRGIDAVEMIMAGASAVQVCTAAILQGSQVLGQIAGEMSRWMDAHGYADVAQMRGLAWRRRQQHLVGGQDWRPRYLAERCIGCGRCAVSCVYQAIRMDEKKAVWQLDRCHGCGLCVTRCPSGAWL